MSTVRRPDILSCDCSQNDSELATATTSMTVANNEMDATLSQLAAALLNLSLHRRCTIEMRNS